MNSVNKKLFNHFRCGVCLWALRFLWKIRNEKEHHSLSLVFGTISEISANWESLVAGPIFERRSDMFRSEVYFGICFRLVLWNFGEGRERGYRGLKFAGGRLIRWSIVLESCYTNSWGVYGLFIVYKNVIMKRPVVSCMTLHSICLAMKLSNCKYVLEMIGEAERSGFSC